MLALFLFVACAQKEPANDNSNKTLSAPRDLKVEQVGDYTLKLDWTDASEGESCFKVYLILPSDIDHPVLKAKVEADCTSAVSESSMPSFSCASVSDGLGNATGISS